MTSYIGLLNPGYTRQLGLTTVLVAPLACPGGVGGGVSSAGPVEGMAGVED